MTGRRYEIAELDVGKVKTYPDLKHPGEFVTFEDAGFRITHNVDGSLYEAPKADEHKAAAGPAKPAEKEG
jgi:hypothetical protein